MEPKRKSGFAFSVAFLLAVLFIAIVMAVFEPSGSSYFWFFGAVFILMWWGGRNTSKKLQEQVEAFSTQLEKTRSELSVRINQLEALLKDAQSPVAKSTPAPAETMAKASHAASSAASPSFTQPSPAPVARVGPIVPPGPVFQTTAPPNLTFEQIGDSAGAPSPGIFERLRPLLNFEELLGTNWLSKIGAGILVLGIAFFLAWQLREVGPAGKVVVGWLTGVAMLGAGVFFERRERYQAIARAGIAAGWALMFFTAYAMNHIAAAHVLNSVGLDMALMLLVAAGMVLHTLRYHSQVVTGLAFLFAFSTLALNRVTDVYSLTAAAVLAAGVAAVALLRTWYLLELCAIAVTYANHFLWLRPIIEPMGKHHHSFPEFLPSAVILVSYWAVFRFSYLWRPAGSDERVSAAASLLNTGLLLAVLKYQSVHPEWAFWALLALGAVELALGQLPAARSRSLPHIVLTATGACLLLTAIPFRYGPEYVSLIWLAEAEAFFLVGVFGREKVFRRVGMFAFIPLFGQLVSYEFARVYGARMDGADVKGEFVPAAICVFVALVLGINAFWIARRRAADFEHIVDRLAMRDLSYAAVALAMAGGWMAFYFSGTAVAWMTAGCALAFLSRRFDNRDLRLQSAALGLFAFLRVLAMNLPAAGAAHVLGLHWSARLVTTIAVVAMGYAAAMRHSRTEKSWLAWLNPGFSWAASTMLTLLLWYELRSASVALAWGVFALTMLEIGLARANVSLRLQAYVAAVCSFLRMAFVNLNATSGGHFTPRLYTIVPLLILYFYLYTRLEHETGLTPNEAKFRPALVFAWLGTLTAVLLLRFELPLDWVAAGWAAAAFTLMAIAWKTGKRVFLHQALLLSMGVVFRGVLHNLYERSYFTPPSHFYSTATVVSAAGLLFATLVFAFRLRTDAADDGRWLTHMLKLAAARPEQILFFLPLALMTAFLAVELRSGLVTVAWGLEAVVVFVFALWIGERSYRLAALGLLLLCIGKIVVIDIWRLGLRDRAITFIILGGLISGVSILYSRNREKVRAYL